MKGWRTIALNSAVALLAVFNEVPEVLNNKWGALGLAIANIVLRGLTTTPGSTTTPGGG